MPAHLTIALTIAFAVLVNAHIIVARSAQFSPAKMLKHMNDMEPEPVRMTHNSMKKIGHNEDLNLNSNSSN